MASILIVEDNPDIAMLYQRLCRDHETETFRSTSEAIEYLSNHRPHLVILDFHLAASHGLDVLDYMRANQDLADTPVLGISADDMLRQEANQKGVSAFLPKPIDLEDFYAVTNNLLHQ